MLSVFNSYVTIKFVGIYFAQVEYRLSYRIRNLKCPEAFSIGKKDQIDVQQSKQYKILENRIFLITVIYTAY